MNRRPSALTAGAMAAGRLQLLEVDRLRGVCVTKAVRPRAGPARACGESEPPRLGECDCDRWRGRPPWCGARTAEPRGPQSRSRDCLAPRRQELLSCLSRTVRRSVGSVTSWTGWEATFFSSSETASLAEPLARPSSAVRNAELDAIIHVDIPSTGPLRLRRMGWPIADMRPLEPGLSSPPCRP